MSKKILFVNFLILFGVFLMLSGCSQKGNNFQELLDEASINNQMNKWVEAWETKNTDYLYDTMVSDGIEYAVTDGNEFTMSDLTIDEFVDYVTVGDLSIFWDTCYESNITIENTNIANKEAILTGNWVILLNGMPYGFEFPIEFIFQKDQNSWLIKDMDWGTLSPYYNDGDTGVEDEPFDPEKHNSYVSFKADGELYVFHDNYAAIVSPMSYVNIDNNNLSLGALNAETEKQFVIDFILEGEESGQLSSVSWKPNKNWNDVYRIEGSDFNVEMEDFDLENGLVQGTFSGHIYKDEDGEGVHITEGFFYINHEFNIPELVVNSPSDGQQLFGDIIISGVAHDDSDILNIDIKIINSKDELIYYTILDSVNDWSKSLDTTKYSNGEYTIEVYAVDEYGNRSYKEGISVDIVN